MILSPLLEFDLLLRVIGRKGEGKGEMEGVDVNYGGGSSGNEPVVLSINCYFTF